MGLAQASSSIENTRVRGRPASENRQNSLAIQRPRIEFFKIYAGLSSPEVIVSIVAGGKNISLSGNRRTVAKILKEASEALWDMEPGQ